MRAGIVYICVSLVILVLIMFKGLSDQNHAVERYTQAAGGWTVVSLDALNLKRPSMDWNVNAIPHVIHQFAPGNRDVWHASWGPCHDSWKHHFDSFEHHLWTDEAIDDFVHRRFGADFYDVFNSFAHPIQRLHVARYLVMYEYGGIYADMDVECMDDFYDHLHAGKANLIYNDDDTFHNALMASPAHHPFWHYVLSEALGWRMSEDVDSSTGTKMLGRVARLVPPQMLHALSSSMFIMYGGGRRDSDRDGEFAPSQPHPNVFAIHHESGTWRR
jgi:mannosyltransferase OCH1-like enzyme